MRPARNACRPAIDGMPHRLRHQHADRAAAAIPVFIRSASTPSSIAIAASEAVPTPASTITGTPARSLMIAIEYGLHTPSPLPIGAASGITAAQPELFELLARDRIVADVRQHGKAVSDSSSRGVERLAGVGMQRSRVADHFEFDKIGFAAVRAPVAPSRWRLSRV